MTTTETYKWYLPDANLRPAYGGATILTNGDASEPDAATLSMRHICVQLGLPAGATRFLFERGVATDTKTWIRVPDLIWAAISPHLTSYETGTVVSTMPAGWVKTSKNMSGQPDPRRFTIYVRGESIPAGLGTTTGDPRDVWISQMLNMVEPITWSDVTNYLEGYTPHYRIHHMSIGGSSWGNTNAAGGSAVYPQVEDLTYNQRTKTIPMNSSKVLFIYTLLTNDAAYDLTLTAAQLWARIEAGIQRLRADFPNLKIAIATTGRRTNDATLNARIAATNVLIRANYKAAGADVLFDIEASVGPLNCTTGDMTAGNGWTTDGIHWTTALHTAVATAMLPTFLKVWP